MSVDARGELGLQLALLREDVQRLAAEAQRNVVRIAQLETALREVRGLLPFLPPHDRAAVVDVRLRRHFDYLATHIIDTALAPSGATP